NPVGGRGISAFSPRFFSAEGIFVGEVRGGRARRRRRPWPGLNPGGKGRRIHPVAVNPATGFGDPSKKAHRRPHLRPQALFLCPQFRVMAAVRGRSFGVCRVPSSRFANLRTAATHRLATIRGSSTKEGA